MTREKYIRMVIGSGLAVLGWTSMASAAKPPQYAYAALDNADFGILSVSTSHSQARFVPCGNSGTPLIGLAAAPNGALLGQDNAGEIYTVSPTNGALTKIGPSGVTNAVALGSSTAGIYNIGEDGSVYSINSSTGAAALLGNLGVSVGPIGISTGYKKVLVVNNSEFASVDTANGKELPIQPSPWNFSALAVLHPSLIFATDTHPSQIFSASFTYGAAGLIATVKGDNGAIIGMVRVPKGAATTCAN